MLQMEQQLIIMKQGDRKKQTVFDLYSKQIDSVDYPYKLAKIINTSSLEYQRTRAFVLLSDWVRQYQSLSQIKRMRHKQYIVLVLNILTEQFRKQTASYSCIASFYSCFFLWWKHFNETLKEGLKAHSTYALQFLWHLGFTFMELQEIEKKHRFAAFVAQLCQEPLRLFRSNKFIVKRKLIDIVFMFNAKTLQPAFINNLSQWCETIKLCQQGGNQDEKIDILMRIVKCKNVMTKSEQSLKFWIEKIKDLLAIIEQIIPALKISNKRDIQIISMLRIVLKQPAIRQYLQCQSARFSSTLLYHMKYNCEQPQKAFNFPELEDIKVSLYEIFYLENQEAIVQKLELLMREIIIKRKITETFSSLQNLIFIENITELQYQLSEQIVYYLIKTITNPHFRKSITVQHFTIFIRILKSSIKDVTLKQDVFVELLRSCTINSNKGNQENFSWTLMRQMSLLIEIILKKEKWKETKHVEYVFKFCQQFERSSKQPNQIILSILKLLIQNQNSVLFSVEMFPKLTQLIKGIKHKITPSTDKIVSTQFFSLLMEVYQKNHWEEGYSFITTFFKSNDARSSQLQIMIILKDDNLCSEAEQSILMTILQDWNQAAENNILLNLLFIQLLFFKISEIEAEKLVSKIQKPLTQLMQILYKDEDYFIFIQLASKCLPWVRNFTKLKSLSCFKIIKNKAFDILGRSFNKTVILAMNSFFCSLLLKTENLVQVYQELNEDNFMDYLFRGMNDFITKEKEYRYQLTITLLLFKIIKEEPIIYQNAKRHISIYKNVGWWIQEKCPIRFNYFLENKKTTSIIFKEFKDYYQNVATQYITNVQCKYYQSKQQKRKPNKKQQDNQ